MYEKLGDYSFFYKFCVFDGKVYLDFDDFLEKMW